MSIGMFGLCCCQKPSPTGCASLAASAVSYGVSNFTEFASLWVSGLDGNKYLQIDSTNVLETTPGVFVTLSGTIIIDAYNGSIVSHTATAPPAAGSTVISAGGYDPWPPTSYTDLVATWADQTITLSSPQSIDDLFVICAALLDAQDLFTLAAENWATEYIAEPGMPFVSGGQYWVPTWVLDPTYIGSPPTPWIIAWVDVTTGQQVLDRDIPAHVAPGSDLRDLGLCDASVTPETTGGPATVATFGQGQALTAALSRFLVRSLGPLSHHCLHDAPDAGAIAAGNSSACFDQDADSAGVLYVTEPGIAIDSTSTGEEILRWIWIHSHPTTGGPGDCPCVQDM